MLIAVPNVSEGRDQDDAGRDRRRRSGPSDLVLATPTTTARCSRSIGRAGRAAQAVLAGASEAIDARRPHAPPRRAPARGRRSTSRRSSTSTRDDRGAACAEALVLADELGRLGVPVYLYGELARRPHARGAATTRRPRRSSRPTSARTRCTRRPARRSSPRGRRWSRSTSRSTRRSQTAKADRAATCSSDARRARARPAAHATRSRSRRTSRTTRASPRPKWSRRSATTPRSPAPSSSRPPRARRSRDFPEDVPLRGPKPLEDHLTS